MVSQVTRYFRSVLCGAFVMIGLAAGQFAHAELITAVVPLGPLGSDGDGGFGNTLTVKFYAVSGQRENEASSPVSPSSTAEATIATQIDHPVLGLVPMTFELDSLNLGLGDTDVLVELNSLGTINLGNNGLVISAQGPTVDGINPLTNKNTFDLAGTLISINQGVITYAGDGFVGSQFNLIPPRDFSVEPMSYVLPAGSTIKTIEEQVDASRYNVTVFLPLDISETLVTDPFIVSMQVFGDLVLTGTKVVPEPGTIVLLGLGAVGFIAFVARRRRG